MPEPILELKGISKRFPGVIALSDVDLSVSPGEVVALIGENGAGKSTLMKILGGVYQADEGTIQVDGREVQIRNVADAQKLGVSLIHQELNNLDNLDIGGNIFLGREPLFGGFLCLVDRKRIAEQSRGYLEKVGLNLPPWTALSSLSIAQQQLVEIAKALSTSARIIVMDEPTSSLTLTETNRLFHLIAELKSAGVSVIYSGEVSASCHQSSSSTRRTPADLTSAPFPMGVTTVGSKRFASNLSVRRSQWS